MNEIVLYSTGCPKCNVLKKKLNAKNIRYVENSNKEEMIKMGMTHVPMLQVDEKLMDFSEANEWVNAQGGI